MPLSKLTPALSLSKLTLALSLSKSTSASSLSKLTSALPFSKFKSSLIAPPYLKVSHGAPAQLYMPTWGKISRRFLSKWGARFELDKTPACRCNPSLYRQAPEHHPKTRCGWIFVAVVSWVMVRGMKGGTIVVALTFCKRLPSHSGQEQACTRITRLFVCLGITMLKMV